MLDDLLTALYAFADDFPPRRDPSRPERKPRVSDAEVICLALARVLLDCSKERRFLRFARRRLVHSRQIARWPRWEPLALQHEVKLLSPGGGRIFAVQSLDKVAAVSGIRQPSQNRLARSQ